MSVWAWVKEHPYETAGGVFAVGAVAIVVLNLGSSGSSSATTDPNAAAELQAEQQSSAEGAQLQAAQLQEQEALDEASLGAQVQALQINTQGQSTDLQTTTAGNVATVTANDTLASNINTNAANVAIQQGNDQTSIANTATEAAAAVSEAGTVAEAQLETALGADSATVDIAGVNAQTQQLLGLYSSQSLETEANDLAAANEAQSSAAQNSAIAGAAGSAFGKVIGLVAGVL